MPELMKQHDKLSKSKKMTQNKWYPFLEAENLTNICHDVATAKQILNIFNMENSAGYCYLLHVAIKKILIVQNTHSSNVWSGKNTAIS